MKGADVLQKCRDDGKKTFEGPRGYCTACAATQIESFGLKPSLERRNCFQIHDLRYTEGNILYNPVLFLLLYLAEFSPLKNILSSASSTTNLL